MKKTNGIIILVLIIFFSIFTILRSFYYSSLTGGADLRNRVVGSRAMAKGYSPYFYKWKPADGEYLLDPNDIPSRLINHNSVTPAILYIFYPLVLLKYSDIRIIWTILQILAATAVVWMMLKRHRGVSRIMAAGIVIFGILTSDYWFFHIERGQIHILYALLFALTYYVNDAKWNYAEFISGFIGGLFILFRPFASMIFLGFLLHGKKNWVKGCITGFAAGILLFVIPDPLLWRDYFKAMGEFSKECLDQGQTIPNAAAFSYPHVIEGTTNLTLLHDFHLSSMHPFFGIFTKLGVAYTPVISYITCSLILAFLSLLFYRFKNHSTTVSLFLFAFLTYKVEELFLISFRTSYSLVLWIFPLFLIVQQIQNRAYQIIILITCLLLLHYVPFEFTYQVFLAETILLLFVLYFSFSEFKIPQKRETV